MRQPKGCLTLFVNISKFSKNGEVFALWRKGNYWYELTYASQSDKGLKHVDEWYNKTLDEIKTDLHKKGYTPLDKD